MDMTRMKRAITLLAALVLTVSLAAPALALGDIDLNAQGTIVTQVQEVLGEDYLEDLASYPVHLRVYQVATVNEYGAFKLTKDFESLATDYPDDWNGGIIYNKVTDETNPTGNEARLKHLLDGALALVPDEDALKQADETGEPLPDGTPMPVWVGDAHTDGDTIKPHQEDSLGLFLVVPGHVQTSLWEYDFNPALLAVPSIARTKDGDPDDGEWVYNVPMYLKGTRERRLMDLEIVKNLRTYNKTLGPVTFVFDVTAMLDINKDGNDELVFQSTAEVTFDETTGYQNKAVVKNIPAGAKVTVTEVYTGQSYELVGSSGGGIGGAVAEGNTVTFEIIDLNLPDGQDIHRVEFTNDYDGGRIPDAHVENIFTANSEFGWKWNGNDRSGSEGGNG